MTDYYVIGDVHGKAGMLEDLLKTWDGQTQLLFLGDLIDRVKIVAVSLKWSRTWLTIKGLSVCQEITSICF